MRLLRFARNDTQGSEIASGLDRLGPRNDKLDCHCERSPAFCKQSAGRSEAISKKGNMDKQYYVYIMTNRKRTLYTGVTNDLVRRVYEQRQKLVDGFTKKYDLSWLVHYETTDDIESAIAREKQIKGWLRRKKVALVESANPRWVDLAQEWYGGIDPCRYGIIVRRL